MTLAMWAGVGIFFLALVLVIWHDERKFRQRHKRRGGMIKITDWGQHQHSGHIHISGPRTEPAEWERRCNESLERSRARREGRA